MKPNWPVIRSLTNELKTCKATVAEIKLKKDALVEKAREKITPEEAKALDFGTLEKHFTYYRNGLCKPLRA